MDDRDVVVAVFGTISDAERARDRLIEAGFPASDIRMGGGERAGVAGTDAIATPRREGFWDWLFGRDVPEYDRPWYEANLREGHTVVSVIVRDSAERHRAAEILEDLNPIDFEESESRYRGIETAGAAATSAYVGPQTVPATDEPLGSPHTWEHQRDLGAGAAEVRPSERGVAAERVGAGDTVIPVVKEDIEVGKRVHERRYRIRTYTVETPVERDVTLRDERVVIERRPVSDPAAAARAAGDMPREREYEVVERHEEPIVEKRQTAEEVVVHKEAEERTERVHDTVRETKVDVDRDAAAGSENLERTVPVPEERKP
jgi:stress response protein YsnF